MNKKMREILAKMEALRISAKTFLDGETKDLDKFNELMDQIDNLNKEYQAEARMIEAEKATAAMNGQAFTPAIPETKNMSDMEKFAKALKAILRKDITAMTELVGADGGYTVPEDISTKVEEYAQAHYSLLQEIDVQNVTTKSGKRPFKKKGTIPTFKTVAEMADLATNGQLQGPQFEQQSYEIEDRSGFIPVSNDLIEDSDANIISVVQDWLNETNIATANEQILTLLTGDDVTPETFTDIDDIKKALVVTLGQAYPGAKIYTNDNGLFYLDTLKDADGRPLLNPDPTQPTQKQLRAGVNVFALEVLPNDVWANPAENTIPFICGDLKQAVRKYDRKQMTVTASDVATIGTFNAFANNCTLIKAICRDDYKIKDSGAFVYGKLTVSE